MKFPLRSCVKLIGVFTLAWLWLLVITYVSNHRLELRLIPDFLSGWMGHQGSPSLESEVRTVVGQDKHAQLKGDIKATKPKLNKPVTPLKSSLAIKKIQRGKYNFTSQSYYSDVALSKRRLTWKEFIIMPPEVKPISSVNIDDYSGVQVCSKERAEAVTRPMLTDEQFKFCEWALSSGNGGGNVKVGKSYGILDGKQREQYERYTCNSVAGGRNPSCDDSFGDEQIRSWRGNSMVGRVPLCSQPGAEAQFTSFVRCSDSRSNARFCVFDNALMDLRKMKSVHRAFSTDTRNWKSGFLSTDCDPLLDGTAIKYYEMYSPTVDPKSTVCDFVYEEPVLVVSHDQSKNLGHTMNDFMNAWAQLWLAGMGSRSKEVTLLSLDAVREGHNYEDQLFQFGLHYVKAFRRVIRASSFPADAKVCFKRLIFLPRPYLLFTWDGWWQDMTCPLVGPSTLYQRWNLDVRRHYGLLPRNPSDGQLMETNKAIHALLVFREVRGDDSNNPHFNSRVFSNLAKLREALSLRLDALSAKTGIATTLSVINLGTLPFEEQVHLVASSSLLIGMHGAGITHAMHMPLGTKFCCGVLEIFPVGEFSPIRGHGNMARRMGLSYDRIFLGKNETNAKQFQSETQKYGSYVPPERFADAVDGLLNVMVGRKEGGGSLDQASCVMPSVLKDPHFENNPGLPSPWK